MSFWRREARPDLPRSFGFKIEWLAVRHADAETVARVVGLRRLKPASWETGLRPAIRPAPFITPPLDGWTLITGFVLPEDAVAFLARASGELATRICHFGSHRVVSAVSWAFSEAGVVRRHYTYADGTTYANVGEPMPEERELNLTYHHELGQDADDDDWDRLPDEETVVELAGRWTIDPTTIEDRFHEPSTGFIAR